MERELRELIEAAESLRASLPRDVAEDRCAFSCDDFDRALEALKFAEAEQGMVS